MTDVCPFPVEVAYSVTGTERILFDRSGGISRVIVHLTTVDTFRANAVTLVGLPYTFNLHVPFDPTTGAPVHSYASGVIAPVPLRGGGTFLSAGRLDFLAHPGAAVRLTHDVGRSGDVESFCAALSGGA